MKPLETPIYVTRPMLPAVEEIAQEIREIWDSQWLTNFGTKHYALEEELTNVLKVPGLSLFNNGTTALLVAIKSLALSGEVITTPFSFPATPHALSWNGITPVFCDIDEATLTIDPAKLEELITPRTTGILGVHVYGMPCQVMEIQEIASRLGLRVIYDAAHAFRTEVDGVGIGNFGDITMFSFHATKLFHTLEGGALAFTSPELKSRINLLRNFGIKKEEEVVLPGINGKMNEVQAAIGLVNLRHLNEEIEKRKTIVQAYKQKLLGIEGLSIFDIPDRVKNSYEYFVIRIDHKFGLTRDEVFLELKKYNIHSRKYFYPLCSNYNSYKSFPSSSLENLPIANKVAEQVLCLPLYGDLSLQVVEQICEIIRDMKN